MSSSPTASWPTEREKVEAGIDFIFVASKITADSDPSHEIQRRLLLEKKPITNLAAVQSLSHVQHFVTPWTAEGQASLSFTNSWSLLKLMSIESVMPSNHLILCRPFLLPPSTFSIQPWPEYWSLSFSIRPSNEYSGIISFRMAWLDLLAVQGTLKSLLQHHSSKASILWCSAFFIVQLTNTYMTTGKTIALTRWTLLAK